MVTYPHDWVERQIVDLTEDVITGGTPSTLNPTYWDGDIPWIASAEINRKYIEKPTRYITSLGLSQSSAKIAPGGSVLIALAGQGKTRGTAAYLASDMAVNQSLAALLPNEATDVWFLLYLLENNYAYLREVSSGDGGRGGLNKKLIRGLSFIVPKNKNEQVAIGKALRSLDEYISDLAALIEKKKAIREGAVTDLAYGRINLDGHQYTWQKTTLGMIASYRRERTQCPRARYISTENMNQMFSGITPYYGTDEISGVAFSPGDSLLANIRPYLRKAWCASFSGSCSSDVLVLAGNEKVVPQFLFYCIANDRFINYVMNGGVKGLKMPRGDKKYIMQYPILMPQDKAEQEAIATMITAMETDISALEAERDKMVQIREGAMNDLLTGRVRLSL